MFNKDLMDKAEMSHEDLELLVSTIKEFNPVKFLEIGVAAGSTSRIIIDQLSSSSIMYSVELLNHYYQDKSKKSGYLMEEYYSEEKHPEWVFFRGKDISECIDDIGEGIDFLLLDTVHSLPGEFLSFLVVLPYMKDHSVVYLHDIALHSFYKRKLGSITAGEKNAYCNSLLFSSIFSRDKRLSTAEHPNSGVVVIDKEYVMNNLFPVLDMLFQDWYRLPDAGILMKTLYYVKEYYLKKDTLFFEQAVQYNLGLKDVFLGKA